jgi:hypothetical protein
MRRCVLRIGIFVSRACGSGRWKAVAGMKDIATHQSHGVMLELVWETASVRVPEGHPDHDSGSFDCPLRLEPPLHERDLVALLGGDRDVGGDAVGIDGLLRESSARRPTAGAPRHAMAAGEGGRAGAPATTGVPGQRRAVRRTLRERRIPAAPDGVGAIALQEVRSC